MRARIVILNLIQDLKLFVLTLSLILSFSLVSFTASTLYAQTDAEKYQEIQKKIAETSAKITDLQKTERDLTQQIDYINSQIKLTELRIEEAQAKIDQLEKEITTLGFRIGYITDSVDRLERLLKQRIVATYQQSFVSNLEILITSQDFSDLILRLQYLKEVQENDKKILSNLLETKSNYANQKDEREDKQAQIEDAKAKLDTANVLLARQKREKNDFLAVTRNDEKRYQEELRRLQADAASISQALGNIGARIGTVSKGDIIGSVGSSGCSTGPHLHFEVFTDAKVEGSKIVGNRVDPKPYLEDGKYEKPVPNYPQNVTVPYGERYFLGIHTGIDIANSFGTPIRAIDGGEAYLTSAPCNYNIAGGTPLGKGVVVDHKNGLVTLYWHIP